MCTEMDDDSWDETFLTSLGTQSSVNDSELDGDDEDDHEVDTENATLPVPKLKSLRGAI